jgi:hypothetical protein
MLHAGPLAPAQLLKVRLRHLALHFSGNRTAAESFAASDHDGKNGVTEVVTFEARTESYANVGLQAYELSRMLRKEYKLPPVQFLAWDPIRHMEDELKKISERQELRAKEFEKLRLSAPSLPVPSSAES